MKISIITVNYNDAEGLEKTLSVETALSLPDGLEKEIIVIDGGSTDGSVEVMKRYKDKIDYSVSERDKGTYHAMNKGVRAATGDFCIFMNSGDTFASPTVLSEIFREPTQELLDADVISGGTFYIDPKPRKKKKAVIYRDAPTRVSMVFFYYSTLSHQASFIRRRRLLQFPYDESLKIVSDLKFWIQCLILDEGKYHQVPVPVARFDMSGVKSRAENAEKNEIEKVFQSLKLRKIVCDYEFILKEQSSLKMRLLRHIYRRKIKEHFRSR
ncbi:MAG: glycosyltransferase family 2 protein [Candidatus Spyradosoma sp.]